MKILAIETSCDETAVAILECTGDPSTSLRTSEQDASFTILGNALLSQIELHQPYGGVYPTLAKREHIKNLPVMLKQALEEAKLSVGDVDAIAVTAGPGLEPALWTGIEFAKKLSQEFEKPMVAVNHMEGHILAALAAKAPNNKLQITNFQMPVLALLISGGHTELVLMKEWLKYELIGQTLDDAVGEAFDKVARMMHLPYPGGPEISKLAEALRSEVVIARSEFQSATAREEAIFQQKNTPLTSSNTPERAFKLPRPMLNDGTCNFSFAGLKTAVLYALKPARPDDAGRSGGNIELTEEKRKEIALEFENAVEEVLWKKTAKALEQTGAKTLVLGGGVSANTHIRREFAEHIKNYPEVALRIPSAALTTDNAIMIALAGYYHALRKEFATEIKANGNLALI